MTNHTPHNRNHNEQRQDERPFAYILKRALLQQQQHDLNIDTTQHTPANPEYQITIEHGSIWLGQER
ncbi:MAG: hypothetical protein U9N43_03315 [Euryarchaeota archaeon]|nr:hypothetical protein [Euryarchaeota archaeon]